MSQIGRFLRGKIISYFHQKLAFFDTLKDKFLGFFGGVTVLLCNYPVELPLYQKKSSVAVSHR